MIGMCRHWYRAAARESALAAPAGPVPRRRRVVRVDSGGDGLREVRRGRLAIRSPSPACCVGLCFLIHRYYVRVGASLRRLDETLGQLPTTGEPNMAEPDPDAAGGRDPGGRLQRPGHPHHAQRHPLRPRPLQELRLRFGGRDRHAATSRAAAPSRTSQNTARNRCASTSISAGGWACPPPRS